MGCTSARMVRRNSNAPSTVTRFNSKAHTVESLQAAWDDHLCSFVLPQGSWLGDHQHNRRQEVSIPMPALAANAINSINDEPPDSFTCGELDRTLFVFDWDDTLYPNTWVQERMGNSFSEEQALKIRKENEKDLSELSVEVIELLEKARSLGRVVIITASRIGWVKKCCDKLMPEIRSIVDSTPVFYALDYLRAEDQDGQVSHIDVAIAKARAMSVALFSIDEQDTINRWTNIVCIGDSSADRCAITQLASDQRHRCVDIEHCRVKTISVLKKPSIDLVIVQVSLLSLLLGRIAHLTEHIDCDLADIRR